MGCSFIKTQWKLYLLQIGVFQLAGVDGVAFHQKTVEALSAADGRVPRLLEWMGCSFINTQWKLYLLQIGVFQLAGVDGVAFHQKTVEALSAADGRVPRLLEWTGCSFIKTQWKLYLLQIGAFQLTGVDGVAFHQKTVEALSAADRRL